MSGSIPERRGNLLLGLALGALAGVVVIVAAWFVLVPRTAPAAATPSPTVRQTTAESASPTATATPSATASATPNPAVVTELPAGTWVTVLKSLPQGSFTADDALAQAATMGNEEHRPVVLDSNAFGFTPNYWVVAVPGAASARDATAVCTDLGINDRNQCYPREIRG